MESSIGMVPIRKPIFSALLYQTIWPSIQLPVRIPLTMKNGIKITKYDKKNLLRSFRLYLKTIIVEINAKLKLTNVYHLSWLMKISVIKIIKNIIVIFFTTKFPISALGKYSINA